MEQTSCIRIKADVVQIDNCKQAVTALDYSFEYLSNALSLAGNNVRLKILFLLRQEQKLCVCDLSDILSMKVSAISQHLRKLKDRNIIHSKRDAQVIFYSLTAEYEQLFEPFFTLIDNNILEEA